MTRSVAFALVLAGLMLSGCDMLASHGLPAIGSARNAVGDESFSLTIESPRTTWSTGEPIDISAELTYTGAAPSADVYGSGSGLVGFDIDQTDGPFDVASASTSDCALHTMTRGKTEDIAFVKSGGWTPDDPLAARLQAFFADPELHLAPGTYTITARLDALPWPVRRRHGPRARGRHHAHRHGLTVARPVGHRRPGPPLRPGHVPSEPMNARVLQVNVSPGGVPKRPVEGPVHVGRLGLDGDGHGEPTVHGGPHRAVCLFASEAIGRVAAEGNPIFPGSCGENLTTEGVELATLTAGTRLAIGETLLLEVSAADGPCETIEGSFADRRFSRINIALHPTDSRMYARVLVEGSVQAGDAIRVLSPDPASRAAAWPLLTRIESARRKFWLANWRASEAAGMDCVIVDDGELALVTAPGIPGPWRNRAIGLTIIPNMAPRAAAFFADHGTTGWADLEPDDAIALGIAPDPSDEQTDWFAAPVERVGEATAPGVTIRMIGPDEVGAWTDLILEAAPTGTVRDTWFRRTAPHLLGTPEQAHRRLFVAELDGHPVGGAALAVGRKVGWLATVGVMPEARGRGIQRALIAARTAVAVELGCDTVAADTEPGTISAMNLAAMGFEIVESTVRVSLPEEPVIKPELAAAGAR